jgi:hypothetical protein
METWFAVSTVRLPADGFAQDTRAVFSAMPLALVEVVDEPDIPGIEELPDACELVYGVAELDDFAEPQPATVTTIPTTRRLSGSSRNFQNACIERPPGTYLPTSRLNPA